MLEITNNGYLTTNQIRSKAPSIFTKSASPEVSSKYTHIPTSVVLEDMSKLGWQVVDAKEVKSRKQATIGYQKHLIVFRNDDVVINGADGDTVYPQILLTNSHDGKNAFTFTAGLFRMVCENGLVISTQQFENVKMRHMGYTFEDLQKEIKEMVEKLPLTVESMNKMKNIEISKNDAVELAKKSLTTRFSEEEIEHLKIDFDAFLEPVREEDTGKDLWTVFNVIQEKIIEGDFKYMSGTKIRKARRVKNFQQDMKINSELFEMAAELVA